MQSLFKKPVFAGAAVLIFGGIVLCWRLDSSPAPSFRTASVKRGDVVASISASGTIEPIEAVDVGAQVAGIVKSFGTDINGKTVDYGSTVEEGAVLARIDDSVYAADFAVAKAQLEQAKAGELSADANLQQMQAKLDQDAAEYKRAEELLKSKLMAQVDFDTDKANYEIAKANVSVAEAGIAQAKATTIQAQAALDKAQRNLDFCTIKSPVKGVIIDRRVNIGQTVVSSLNAPSLFLIAEDLSKMQIWVSVNEADVGRIVPGAPVTFTCNTFPGREFKGTVGQVRLNATMTQNIVIYTVIVNTDNSDKTLLPYLTANVNFVTQQETNALLVPNEALRWSPATLAEIAPEFRSQVQASPSNDPPDSGKSAKKSTGLLWLKDGAYVRPVEVKTGTTDGVNTAVAASDLQAGQTIVTGERSNGTEAAARNPFVPVIRR